MLACVNQVHDRQRIAPVAQRHLAQPAGAMGEALLAAPERLLEHRQFGPGQVVLDQRMRGRLADEDEVPADLQHRLAERRGRPKVPSGVA
jgi:hypothetical protein